MTVVSGIVHPEASEGSGCFTFSREVCKHRMTMMVWRPGDDALPFYVILRPPKDLAVPLNNKGSPFNPH